MATRGSSCKPRQRIRVAQVQRDGSERRATFKVMTEKTNPDIELAQRICDLLNELLEIDRPAIAALIANRVPCNEALSNHPTVQVGVQHGGYHVGMLGILNGLCGIRPSNSFGLINAIFEQQGDSRKFEDLLRFEVHTDAD